MSEYFDETHWRKTVRQPDWYIKLYPELQALQTRWQSAADEEVGAIKEAVRDFFEMGLRDGTVALGKSGQNLDAARQPIDTIVIHHTGAEPGYRLSRLNAVQLLNVYVPYFNNPTDETEQGLKGQPLWSNHVRHGRPVFYLYHWLMRMDGSFERLLEDQELGWHAANWDINRRSVAICLDNNYENRDPEPAVLQKLAGFIVEHYPGLAAERVMGHKEVSHTSTVCPGGNFVDGWKDQLVRLIGHV